RLVKRKTRAAQAGMSHAAFDSGDPHLCQTLRVPQHTFGCQIKLFRTALYQRIAAHGERFRHRRFRARERSMRGTLLSETHGAPVEPDEVLDLGARHKPGDGLPLTPPPAERVQAMLDAVGESPDAVIGIVEPQRGEAPAEKIAINAVMAGCKPEYFPAVVAAV